MTTTSPDANCVYFTLDQKRMDEKMISIFENSFRNSHEESEYSGCLNVFCKYINELSEQKRDAALSEQDTISYLIAKEEENSLLVNLLIFLQDCELSVSPQELSIDIAEKILDTYSDRMGNSKVHSSEATQHCLKKKSHEYNTSTVNPTWPSILPGDLHARNIIATSALMFKTQAEGSTGSSKRPRVDPHTLLQPISRLHILNEIVFVQYTSRFFLGFDSTKIHSESIPLAANGLNIANNYFDLSPFSQRSSRSCKYHGCIFYDEVKKRFYLIPYSYSGIRIGKEDMLSKIFDFPVPLENGDVFEIMGVQIFFEVARP